ncbi:hypothetical protein DFH09DRAFT_1328055 [Mycena vulgaris]|nr:hypothetical protein DFH09DRAFT_1328055 [Mycena vulgaris]
MFRRPAALPTLGVESSRTHLVLLFLLVHILGFIWYPGEWASTAPVITRLQPSEILKWRTSISVAMGGAEEFLPLDISGPDVEAVATTLLDLVQVACCDGQHLDEFAPANNNVVLEVPVAVKGFFHTGRKFNM